jgi:hypothetical protein
MEGLYTKVNLSQPEHCRPTDGPQLSRPLLGVAVSK